MCLLTLKFITRRLLILKKSLLWFFIFLISTSAFARGEVDIQLADIDALIAESRINEALILAERYLRENPDDFVNAQKRIDKIFKFRNDYKQKTDELVRIIVNEPLNDKKKLDIIAELEAMERNPNEQDREFIERIKVSSQFTYFRALYEQIIEDGTELLLDKEYAQSAQRFTDGFELYYDDFFDQGFNNALVNAVVSQVGVVTDSLDDYVQVENRFKNAFDSFNNNLSRNDIEDAIDDYNDILQAIDEFAEIRNTNILAGYYLKEQSDLLQEQFPELTDAFFLPFAYRLLLGRGNEEEANIVKAMDSQWEDSFEDARDSLSSAIAFYTEDLTNVLNSQPITQREDTDIIKEQAEQLRSLVVIGEDLLSQYEILNDTETTFLSNPHIAYQDLLDYSNFLLAQTDTLVNYADLLIAQRLEVEEYLDPQSPDTIIKSGSTDYKDFLAEAAQTNADYSTQITGILENMDEQASIVARTSSSFGIVENKSYPELINLKRSLDRSFDFVSDQNYIEALQIWERMSIFIAEGSTLIQTDYSSSYADSIPLINETLTTATLSNPELALSTLEDIVGTLDQDIQALETEYNFLQQTQENEALGVQNSQTFEVNREQIQSDIASLEEIRVASEEYIVLATQRVRLAQQAENEADLRFSQAEEFLDQENFSASRDALQRARTKYNEALSYQYTEELRIESDEKLAALGDEIAFIENEIIVQNVRNLITSSRQNYYNSNFTQAESLILQAESQWAITNVTPNPEVVALKALIGNALSITTGRTIPPTDPLYPEMSQTLNVAYRHFDNAQNLLEQNNRDDAINELNQARNKIRDVQVLYPFHQEAGLLALRIDQLIDPVAFEDQFAQKFEQAQEDYDDPNTSTRAYVDLLDLYEINPDYPGLENFIYVVELDLGIILPPPDIAALSRSTSLTNQASNIYNNSARNEINLNNALTLLNEAVSLNPENQNALILLDRINTSLGGGAVVILSSAAENLYQQAIQELANGNVITASALVTQLLQLPNVQNSAKIIDLKQRVDSLL